MQRVDAVWYGGKAPPWHWQLGSAVFGAIAAMRRWAYRSGLFNIQRLSCPVIVVGNISVGGTGKTPLILCLVERLQMAGYRPGIVSRGYGGTHRGGPLLVTADMDPARVGDEAVLLARNAGLPVAIGRARAAVGRYLIEHTGVNLLLADDGLQHYALGRDIEICVVDGERRFGNGRLFPAGPLRESEERLKSVDIVVANGVGQDGEHAMQLAMQDAWALADNRRRPLRAFREQRVHAVAGIGNPGRFFAQLRDQGLDIVEHAYPDHHRFTPDDLDFGDDDPVLMTEKDAVKCRLLPAANAWAVPVTAELPEAMLEAVFTRLTELQLPRNQSQ